MVRKYGIGDKLNELADCKWQTYWFYYSGH